ncbi:MAG: 3-dehydroquinate synthase [Paracoccaceae bacterium]
MIRSVPVALGDRSYVVEVGPGLIDALPGRIAPLLRRPRVAVVADAAVARLHGARLRGVLDAAGIEQAWVEVPAGEAAKSWDGLRTVCEALLDAQVERGDLVLALGGGVTGDLAGFACAVLRRGVRFVQLPTTLLAQVDSSVGGKTGINTRHGKNLIGAFHQPSLVLADTDVLSTLPRRDLLAGYGEVVKYGLLSDAAFFDWLEGSACHALDGDGAALVEMVARCVAMKAAIVARDETEAGERAHLNLGHTFCHALEAATGYSDRLLHGEGVAIGCALALDLSAKLGHAPQEDGPRVRAHLEAMGIAASLRDIPGDLPPPEVLLKLMGQDKKVVAGQLRFVLTRGIGAAFVSGDVPPDAVIEVLRNG